MVNEVNFKVVEVLGCFQEIFDVIVGVGDYSKLHLIRVILLLLHIVSTKPACRQGWVSQNHILSRWSIVLRYIQDKHAFFIEQSTTLSLYSRFPLTTNQEMRLV